MCVNFVVNNLVGTITLVTQLGVDPGQLIYSNNHKAGSRISIVTGAAGQRQMPAAIWWLYLQQTPQGLAPHKEYFSVNTNHAKLPQKVEYKVARCIVPASGFVESQDGKHPHLLEPADESAIAFGGLYKTWTDQQTGELVYSASIITLPGHPALEHIHRKSTPLWLPATACDRWLDPAVTDTREFDELLKPALRTPLRATPVDKVGTKRAVAEGFVVGALG